MITANVVTVGTSAGVLVPAVAGTDAVPDRHVSIRNKSTLGPIYVGPPGVTAATGYEIPASGSLQLRNVLNAEVIHAVAAMAGTDVCVLQTGV